MNRLGLCLFWAMCPAFALAPLDAVRMHDFEGFSLYGVENLQAGLRNYVYGGSVGSNQSMSFASDFHITKDVYSGGTAYFGNWGHDVGGKVYHKGVISYESWATPQYSKIPEQTISTWTGRQIQTKLVPYGTQDFILAQVSDVTILPGSYRDLKDGGNSNIRLKSGEYNFRTFITEDATRLYLDVTNGPITINVEGKIQIGDMLSMNFTPSVKPLNVRWYTNTDSTILSGQDVKLFGVFTAPKAEFKLEQRSVLVGAVQAKKITMVDDSKACTPPTLKDMYHSSVAMGPFFTPWNVAYKAIVPENTDDVKIFAYADAGVTVTYSPQNLNPTNADQLLKVTLVDPTRESYVAGCGTSEYTLKVKEDPNYKVYVKGSASCGANCDGDSWPSAYTTLGKGLEKAQVTGKEIWLAKGSYWTENRISNESNGVKGFSLTSGAKIRGGFGGDEVSLEKRSATVIDVKILGRDPAFAEGDPNAPLPADHVLYFEGGNPFIERITIQGGKTHGSGVNTDGAGILAINSNLAMDYVWINNNLASKNGGGLGIYGYAGIVPKAILTNSYLSNNSGTSGYGGGVYIKSSTADIFNTIFFSNTASQGGAIGNSAASPHIVNASIAKNTATKGSGLFNELASNPLIENTVIWNNSGSSIENKTGNTPKFKSSNVAGAVTGGVWNGAFGTNLGGNIDADPKFLNLNNPLGVDNKPYTTDDGLQLLKESPSVDKGINPAIKVVEEDIFEVSRPTGAQYDQGAFEFYEIASGDVAVGYYVAKTKNFFSVTSFKVAQLVDNQGQSVDIAANSSAGYTIKLLATKNKHLKDSFYGYVRTLNNNAIFSQGVQVTFYKVGEENGKLVYASKRSDGTTFVNGKPIIFTTNKQFETAFNQFAYIIHAPIAQNAMSVLVEVPHSQF